MNNFFINNIEGLNVYKSQAYPPLIPITLKKFCKKIYFPSIDTYESKI